MNDADINNSGFLKKESLSWESPLKTLELNEIEHNYGAIANDLAELAELIAKAQDLFYKELKNERLTPVVFPSENKKREMYIKNRPTGMKYNHVKLFCLGQATYKAVVCIHYSVKKLKHVLKNIIGDNTAEDFYERVRDSLEYVTVDNKYFDGDVSKLILCGDEVQDGKTKIDRILKELRDWHEISISKLDAKKPVENNDEKKSNPGRPKVREEEAENRREIKANWEEYRNAIKGSGKKESFCEDNGITVEYLNNSVLRWCRDHPK